MVTSLDKANYTAQAKFVEYLGEYVIDNDEPKGFQYLLSQIAQEDNKGSNKVGIYCTHSDESYVPTDGTESEPEEGGIFDVADALEKALKERGCEVLRSETPHEPHDAGAYRRSRQTAVEIMEEVRPAILADLHRDAVPPEVYETEVEGDEVSKVRMVIGASNQNKEANEEFAREIKQIADDKYPELIKDIYIGKGSYNQDLMPQCILFEMGTHTIEKELAIESTDMLADVLATQMGVAVPEGDDDAERAPQAKQGEQPDTGAEVEGQQQAARPAAEENSGTWRSILLTLVVVSIVGLGVLFIYNSQATADRSLSLSGGS